MFLTSPELQGQFSPKLAQIILRQRGFRIVQMKVNTLPKGEIIAKVKISKNLLQNQ
jgi:hypothetical protein